MDRRLVLAALAVPFIVQVAAAADPVVVDNFNNGSVSDTDSIPGFWAPRLSGSLSSANEAGGNLLLNAGGSQYPHGQVASAVDPNINFFRTPVVIEGTGLNFTSSTNSLNKSIFRISMASRQILDAAPANPAVDDSEYWADDVLALRIESGNNIAGQYNVALGIKENYPVHNSEYDGYQLFNPGNNSGATQSGPVRSFRLTYSPLFWDLQLIHDTSPTNTTPVTAHFTGGVDQFMTNWKDSTDAGALTGNSSVILQTQLNNAGGTEQTTAALDQLTISQLRQGWQGASGANWSDAASWSDGSIFHMNGDNTVSSVPNFIGANVKFANAASPTIVTVDLDQTLGSMLFDSAQSFTVQPGGLGQGTLQMATRWFANEVNVKQGSHTVISPINTYNNINVDAAAGATVNLAGQVTDLTGAGTAGLTKTGPGTLGMLNLRLYNVAVNGGTVQVLPGATNNSPETSSLVYNMTIAGGPAAPTARLDLSNNAMVLDYNGASPLNDVRQLLLAGTTSGNGIISSASTARLRLGYAEGSLIPGGSFAGQTLDGTSVVIAFTIGGDATLNSTVNLDDFTALAANFGSPGVWTSGDFDYNGSVNLDDFTILASNFGLSAADQPRGSTVPEPASIGLVLGVGLLASRRRRA